MPDVLRSGAAKLYAHLKNRLRFIASALVVAGGAAAFSSCSVTSVLTPQVDVGAQTSSVSQSRGLARLVPSNPMMAAYPRFQPPAAAGMSMPADEVACRKQLRRLGVTYKDLAPINDGGACQIDYPVQVQQLSGNIGMKPHATLTCAMAVAFASWTKNELASAARWKYLSGVQTIHQGSSYSCRNIRRSGGVASEHSKGNALDVMRIELKNGRDIDVRKPGWFAFREKSLLKNVRSGGCQYFTTVLGPGYDADHADHFHFDIKNRRNGYVACR
jgi:hypothetical protein